MSHHHSQEPQAYTAYITSCKRDIHTSSIKCLITDIYNENNIEFRNHVWVPLSDELIKIQPKNGNNKKKLISFTAEIQTYQSSTGQKLGLKNITNIKLIKGNKNGHK